MPLFKNIETFKVYVEATLGLEFEDIEPSLNFVAIRNIKPVLGEAEYDAIVSAYSSAPSDEALTEDQLSLVKAIRLPLANFALAMAIPRLQVSVSSAGVHISTAEGRKTAFAWQIKQVVDSYLDSGDGGIDELLAFLENHKATYTAWASSSAYTVFKDCFVNTTDLFDSIRPINRSRRLFLLLKPTMKLVQDQQVLAALGKDYYDELMQEVHAGTFTSDNEYPLSLVRRAVVYITCATAISDMIIQLDRDGLTVTASRNTDEPQVKNAADKNVIAPMARKWLEAGEAYIEALRKFLNEKATASLYSNYYNSDKYRDPAIEEGRYTNDKSFGVGLF